MTRFARKIAALAIVAMTCGTLYFSYLIKEPCVEHAWGGAERFEDRNLCYNDVQALYGERHLDRRAFPYIVEKSYEYPVVMGLAMWGTSSFATNYNEYFRANLPLLSLAALLTLLGLWGGVGPSMRLLWFAAGTPLLFYAFLNWDLLAVACVALAIWAYAKRRDGWAGAAIGVGIAAKIYPVFILPALLLERSLESGTFSLRARCRMKPEASLSEGPVQRGRGRKRRGSVPVGTLSTFFAENEAGGTCSPAQPGFIRQRALTGS